MKLVRLTSNCGSTNSKYLVAAKLFSSTTNATTTTTTTVMVNVIRPESRVKERKKNGRHGRIVSANPSKKGLKGQWLVLFDGTSEPEAKTSHQLFVVDVMPPPTNKVPAPPSLILSTDNEASTLLSTVTGDGRNTNEESLETRRD